MGTWDFRNGIGLPNYEEVRDLPDIALRFPLRARSTTDQPCVLGNGYLLNDVPDDEKVCTICLMSE